MQIKSVILVVQELAAFPTVVAVTMTLTSEFYSVRRTMNNSGNRINTLMNRLAIIAITLILIGGEACAEAVECL